MPEDGLVLPCDILLLNGTAIVNEAMLTGESTPVIKSNIPKNERQLNINQDSKNILFAGTKLIQKRETKNNKVFGVVLYTAFNTQKGNIIRNILHPKELEFKFKQDSIKYIIFMGILSIIGFCCSIPILIKIGLGFWDIILKSLDIITCTVPPSLPTCLGIGISYAVRRLKKYGITCIDRERVNVAGKVNFICFDKTGTLTEDYLDIYGFKPIIIDNFNSVNFMEFIDDTTNFVQANYNFISNNNNNLKNNFQTLENQNQHLNLIFNEAIASCHSLTMVKDKLVGDPIDVKMFESSKWLFKENNFADSIIELSNSAININQRISTNTFVKPRNLKSSLLEQSDNNKILAKVNNTYDESSDKYELEIIKQFEFTPNLLRMSVIVKNTSSLNSHNKEEVDFTKIYKAFCKGSPEKIKELCNQESIPSNFDDVLNSYTSKGFRVLGISYKTIELEEKDSSNIIINEFERDAIESQMTFIGLMIVQNKLKEQTKSSIERLNEANLKMVMATGDNILTAIAVSKECSLIKPKAKIYSCEVSQENKLIWNFIENIDNTKKSDNALNSDNIDLYDSNKHMIAQDANSPPIIFRKEKEDFYNKIENSNLNKDNSKNKLQISPNTINYNNKDIDFDMCKEINNLNNNKGEEYIIAINGHSFEAIWKLKNEYKKEKSENYKIFYDTFRFILANGYIFARMNPEHKSILIESLREEQFTVCMCGDGANDCRALRAADVGVSLSSEEASIAAPFTSKVADISCLVKLFIEGKGSLVSSVSCFKFVIVCSLMQFSTAVLCASLGARYSNNQFLTLDLFITFPISLLITK